VERAKADPGAGRSPRRQVRPAAQPGVAERLHALQRTAGNRATGQLLRTFRQGKRKIPDKQLDEIEAKLRADLDGTFPDASWRLNRHEDAGPVKLGDWLAQEKLDDRYTATDLINYAREQRRAKAPPPPTLPLLGSAFFGGFSSATHYGLPSQLDPALIDESSQESSDWPSLPVAVADPELPAWNEAEFLGAFADHINVLREEYANAVAESGGERAYELEVTDAPDRRLMDLAWVLDKLNAGRTCVAAIFTGFSIRLYANAIDSELANDALRVETAAAEAGTASHPTFDALMQRMMDATRPRLGTGEVEAQTKYTARAEKAARRIYKAGKEIAELRAQSKPADLQIVAHAPHQAGKHAEMRLIDASHNGLVGAVAISKICCAKCYAAIRAARIAKRAELDVQGAHWATYATTAGWPIPHFLKESAAAMQAFLGDEAYAWYVAYPTEAAAAIEGDELNVKRLTRTDPYSSDEDEPTRKKSRTKKKD
jgi:hypothetical protein